MDPVAARPASGEGRLNDLHIRLVGGSLLRRTVLSVAAFTMTTCLLLGLISMAAVGATRAIVGGGDAPADETAVDAAPADDEASDGASGADRSSRGATPKGTARSSGSRTAKARPPGRRAGGAVAPADALRGAGVEEDGS